jgi:hypothetical protein
LLLDLIYNLHREELSSLGDFFLYSCSTPFLVL